MQLFINNNNIRIEVQADSTKRHKWDGVMSTTDRPKATVVLIKFAGGFGQGKDKKVQDDTTKLYRNAMRLLNQPSTITSANQPRVFTVLTFKTHILFEQLTLVHNQVYVRTRKAEAEVPVTARAFKEAMAQMPSIFAWRNSVLNSVNENVVPNTDCLETMSAASTP